MHQEQYKLDCLFPFSSPDLAQRHINDLEKPAFGQFHFFEEVFWVLVGTLTKGLDVEEDFFGFWVVAGYSGRDLEAERCFESFVAVLEGFPALLADFEIDFA